MTLDAISLAFGCHFAVSRPVRCFHHCPKTFAKKLVVASGVNGAAYAALRENECSGVRGKISYVRIQVKNVDDLDLTGALRKDATEIRKPHSHRAKSDSSFHWNLDATSGKSLEQVFHN